MIWKEVMNKIADREEKIPSPFVKEAFVEHYYILMDVVSRSGFFMAWCPVSFKGIQVSRVIVPPHFSFLTLEEFKEKVKVPPNIIWMDPTK